MPLGLNILLVFVFLLLGSVFSGTELALVSLRGSQIDQMEQEDARGARVAAIARDPNTFLSTVQIGVTLSGFLSASFGESAISPSLVPVVESWGCPCPCRESPHHGRSHPHHLLLPDRPLRNGPQTHRHAAHRADSTSRGARH